MKSNGGKGFVRRLLMRATAFFCILPLLPCLLRLPALAYQPDAAPVIRVGYPIQTGLTEIDHRGNYRGYTYDYLMEIARYTGWTYRFITPEGDQNEQLSTLMDMLDAGQIDLMGGMTFSNALAQRYDYTATSYGYASYALFALSENTELTSSNYFNRPMLRVAVPESGELARSVLEGFAATNSIPIKLLAAADDEEMRSLLRRGQADVMLQMDIGSSLEGLRLVARISQRPFYFAASRGSSEVVRELNAALSQIDEINPEFSVILHQRYFSSGGDGLFFSKREQNFIEQTPAVRVLMNGGFAPLQYRGSDGAPHGLSVDLVHYLSEATGIPFEIEIADSLQEYNRLLESGGYSMIAGLSNLSYHQDPRVLSLSVPYLTAPTFILLPDHLNPSQIAGKRLALSQQIYYTGQYEGEPLILGSPEQCLLAMADGRADYCYLNSYTAGYYLNDPRFPKITALMLADDWSQSFHFGMLSSSDSPLHGIIDKALRNIPENLLQESLYHNSYHPQKITFIGYLQANPEQVLAFCVILLLLGTVGLLLHKRRRERLAFESQRREYDRYDQLNSLTDVFLFEYDLIRDRLRLPKKTAALLGCEPQIEELSHCLPPGREESILAQIAARREGSFELLHRFPNRSERWVRVTSRLLTGSDGAQTYLVGRITDIQQEKEQHAELLNQAQMDGLTGLYNAAASHRMIIEALQAEGGAMFIVDADHFKEINDTLGHYAGDQALRGIAGALRHTFRKADIVGRLGGDEFIVFMRGEAQERVIMEKYHELRRRIADVQLPNATEALSVSVGITRTEAGADFVTIYQRADKALYAVKGRGRDGVELI